MNVRVQKILVKLLFRNFIYYFLEMKKMREEKMRVKIVTYPIILKIYTNKKNLINLN